ncbi:MAG: energy-coupled thiamine transporter ThiT [Clostridiales bacterium]|nr:energy-coupled thiamine transporter ThiT [Clostridiales bacterium]
MKNTKLITMIEGAIIAGVCAALSYVPLNTANAAFDISLGLIPLGVYALRRGLLPGMAVGFVWGLLLIVLGRAYFLTIPQIILEYPLAFAFGGFGGILSGRFQSAVSDGRTKAVVLSVVFAGILAPVTRWFFHFWAGVIFWGTYAPEGMSPYLYSFIMNGASAAANAVMLVVVLLILVRTARIIFVPKDRLAA